MSMYKKTSASHGLPPRKWDFEEFPDLKILADAAATVTRINNNARDSNDAHIARIRNNDTRLKLCLKIPKQYVEKLLQQANALDDGDADYAPLTNDLDFSQGNKLQEILQFVSKYEKNHLSPKKTKKRNRSGKTENISATKKKKQTRRRPSKTNNDTRARVCNRCGISNKVAQFANNLNMCQFHRNVQTRLYVDRKQARADGARVVATQISRKLKDFGVYTKTNSTVHQHEIPKIYFF